MPKVVFLKRKVLDALHNTLMDDVSPHAKPNETFGMERINVRPSMRVRVPVTQTHTHTYIHAHTYIHNPCSLYQVDFMAAVSDIFKQKGEQQQQQQQQQQGEEEKHKSRYSHNTLKRTKYQVFNWGGQSGRTNVAIASTNGMEKVVSQQRTVAELQEYASSKLRDKIKQHQGLYSMPACLLVCLHRFLLGKGDWRNGHGTRCPAFVMLLSTFFTTSTHCLHVQIATLSRQFRRRSQRSARNKGMYTHMSQVVQATIEEAEQAPQEEEDQDDNANNDDLDGSSSDSSASEH